jgi:hypothetical protein
MFDPLTVLVAATAVFAIAFLKGAFGGGFAILGIPLLALVMDPISGGALLAPLFLVMDVFAFRYWRPSTWSWPDLLLLVPGLLLGSALGFIAMRQADRHLVAVAIALITLGFAVLWFAQGGRVVVRPRLRTKGALAGFTSGVTSMIAHSGGPPVAMYLLPLGLPNALYARHDQLVLLRRQPGQGRAVAGDRPAGRRPVGTDCPHGPGRAARRVDRLAPAPAPRPAAALRHVLRPAGRGRAQAAVGRAHGLGRQRGWLSASAA